jgi:hypothetical protein
MKTLGQIAFEGGAAAYKNHRPDAVATPWEQIDPVDREGWEGVARAVVAAYKAGAHPVAAAVPSPSSPDEAPSSPADAGAPIVFNGISYARR